MHDRGCQSGPGQRDAAVEALSECGPATRVARDPHRSGHEPCPRVWDPALTASPWRWLRDQFASLGAAQPDGPWPIDPADAELSGLADAVVTLARQVSPERCHSAAECFGLTRDARESVQLMIGTVRQRDRLDVEWVKPWQAAR